MDLRRIDLNLLVALDALLTERHVTRAAQRLSVSQPTMSASLARLRKLLGDPLLIRTGNVLQLTPYAESLQVPIGQILARIDETLTARPEFDPATDVRTFEVVCTDYIALLLIRPLVERLVDEAPAVRLRVKPVPESYADELRRDQMDLLVLPEEIAGTHVADAEREVLFDDRYVCAACQHHPDLAEGISVEHLQRLPYLAWRAHGVESFVDRQLDELGITRRVEVTTENFVIAPFLLRGTHLYTMIQQHLGEAVAEAAGIQLLEPPLELAGLTQTMYWHPRRTDDPAHRWFRERLAGVASRFTP